MPARKEHGSEDGGTFPAPAAPSPDQPLSPPPGAEPGDGPTTARGEPKPQRPVSKPNRSQIYFTDSRPTAYPWAATHRVTGAALPPLTPPSGPASRLPSPSPPWRANGAARGGGGRAGSLGRAAPSSASRHRSPRSLPREGFKPPASRWGEGSCGQPSRGGGGPAGADGRGARRIYSPLRGPIYAKYIYVRGGQGRSEGWRHKMVSGHSGAAPGWAEGRKAAGVPTAEAAQGRTAPGLARPHRGVSRISHLCPPKNQFVKQTSSKEIRLFFFSSPRHLSKSQKCAYTWKGDSLGARGCRRGRHRTEDGKAGAGGRHGSQTTTSWAPRRNKNAKTSKCYRRGRLSGGDPPNPGSSRSGSAAGPVTRWLSGVCEGRKGKRWVTPAWAQGYEAE